MTLAPESLDCFLLGPTVKVQSISCHTIDVFFVFFCYSGEFRINLDFVVINYLIFIDRMNIFFINSIMNRHNPTFNRFPHLNVVTDES